MVASRHSKTQEIGNRHNKPCKPKQALAQIDSAFEFLFRRGASKRTILGGNLVKKDPHTRLAPMDHILAVGFSDPQNVPAWFTGTENTITSGIGTEL